MYGWSMFVLVNIWHGLQAFKSLSKCLCGNTASLANGAYCNEHVVM